MSRPKHRAVPSWTAHAGSIAALVLALAGLLAGGRALAFADDVVPPGTLLLDVDTVEDSNDANPGDGICADRSDRCSLRAAVQEFNAFGPDEGIIRLPGGTYTLTLAGAGDLLSATGDLNVTGGVLRISGSEDPAAPTVVEGLGSWDDRLITVANASALTIENMVMRGGFSWGNGGAIWADATASLTLRYCRITGNTASGNGGGVAAYGIDFTVESCRIDANVAGRAGGGIYTEATNALVRATTIDGNTADLPGGGLWAYSELGSAAVVNSTVSGNDGTSGGGIFSAGNVALYNVTVSSNSASRRSVDDTPLGGGVYALGLTELRSSLIAGNAAGDSTEAYAEDCYGDINDIKSRRYNLIGDVVGCWIDNDTGDLFGNSALDQVIDARLGTLRDNGGAIPTHALLEGSPAIDAGDPNGCLDETSTVLVTDQRGFDRPIDGDEDGASICDIGAVEVLFTESPSGGGGGGCSLSHDEAGDTSLPLLLLAALVYLGLKRRKI